MTHSQTIDMQRSLQKLSLVEEVQVFVPEESFAGCGALEKDVNIDNVIMLYITLLKKERTGI